jgi:hypothetical protein
MTQFSADFLRLVAQYQKAEAELAKWKPAEGDLRRAVCDILFEGKTGKFTVDTTDGNLHIIAKSKITLSIDEEEYAELEAGELLSEEEKECIDWKIKLKVGKFNKLPADAELRSVVTSKPAMPDLSVE